MLEDLARFSKVHISHETSPNVVNSNDAMGEKIQFKVSIQRLAQFEFNSIFPLNLLLPSLITLLFNVRLFRALGNEKWEDQGLSNHGFFKLR